MTDREKEFLNDELNKLNKLFAGMKNGTAKPCPEFWDKRFENLKKMKTIIKRGLK